MLRANSPASAVVFIIVVTIVGIELVLQASDQGLIGSRQWRGNAFHFGAFWPGLLGEWRPHYPFQSATMFFTYSFLHGGIGHLLGNAISLWSLGPVISARTGQVGFALFFLLSAVGGALCFAVMSPGNIPMVGASGAIFGLAGLWLSWQWQAESSRFRRKLRILTVIGLLIGLNLALYVWYDGALAWQTHFGGYIVGWISGGVCSGSRLRR